LLVKKLIENLKAVKYQKVITKKLYKEFATPVPERNDKDMIRR